MPCSQTGATTNGTIGGGGVQPPCTPKNQPSVGLGSQSNCVFTLPCKHSSSHRARLFLFPLMSCTFCNFPKATEILHG